MESTRILGVRVGNLTLADACSAVRNLLSPAAVGVPLAAPQSHHCPTRHIVTPNPEFIVTAQSNLEFRNILNSAALCLPDGFGLILASWFLGHRIKRRITGTDFLLDLLREAAKLDQAIYLLGGLRDLQTAALAKQRFEQLIPGLRIVGAEQGTVPCSTPFPQTQPGPGLIERIRQSGATVLIVCWGAPYQEQWMVKFLDQLPQLKLAMAAGSALDYYAGTMKRAPAPFRWLGLEWLHRLAVEPRRWKRIWNAVVVFPLRVALSKFYK